MRGRLCSCPNEFGWKVEAQTDFGTVSGSSASYYNELRNARNVTVPETQISISANTNGTCRQRGSGFNPPSCTVGWTGYTGYVSVLICSSSVPDVSYNATTPGCHEVRTRGI
eukprot:tig00020912_g15834.t1